MKTLLTSLALGLLFCTSTQAQINNALAFDGSDDRVDCGNDTTLRITGTQLTLEAWIYPTFFPKAVYESNIINKEYNTGNYGFMFRIGDQGRLNFAIGDGSWHELTSSGYVVTISTWQHVAATYDGSMMRIYVNGVAVDSLSETASIYNAINTPLLLGGHTTYTRYFQGMMDEVKIWAVCRTAAQISADMNRELCDRPAGLRAYYKFNQGKPSQSNSTVRKLNDLGPYKNNGTLNGFTLNGSSSNWVAGKTFAKDVVNVSDTVLACARYTSPSKKYTWIKSGVYYDTIPTVVMGCDSAIKLHLTINKVSSNQFKVHACSAYVSPSGKYTWTKAGVYNDYLKNYLGCDSIITITLTFGGSRDSLYPDVCNAYVSPKGNTYTISGYYSDTLVNWRGCDSIKDIFLTVRNRTQASISRQVCNGMMSPGGKQFWTQTGIYHDTIPNRQGCDSIITVNLKVLKSESTVQADVCNGYRSPSGSYFWTTNGTYRDTISNYVSCDSIITVQLRVRQTTRSNASVNACRYWMHRGRIITQAGTYHDTLVNAAGCDSIVTISLQVTTFNTAVQQNGAVLTAANAPAWQWLDCSNGYSHIPGATLQTFTAGKNGQYAVRLHSGSCADTSDCYTVSGLGLAGVKQNLQAGVFPNPGQGDFTIMLPELMKDATLRITDVSGRTVFEKQYPELKTETVHPELQPGYYMLTISNGVLNYNVTLIKQSR